MSLSEAVIRYKSYISTDSFVIIISFQVLSVMFLMDVLDIMILKTFQNIMYYDTCTLHGR